MFLYVVATKIVTHFNNNEKELKLYKQGTQKLKQRAFSEVI